MQSLVVENVKDGEQDQARGAGDGEDDAEPDEGLFAGGLVRHEPPAVTEPALGKEGDVERNDDDAGAGNEERFETGGANVADVGNVCIGPHGREVLALEIDDPVEEETEKHAQPNEGGEDGQQLEVSMSAWCSWEGNEKIYDINLVWSIYGAVEVVVVVVVVFLTYPIREDAKDSHFKCYICRVLIIECWASNGLAARFPSFSFFFPPFFSYAFGQQRGRRPEPG